MEWEKEVVKKSKNSMALSLSLSPYNRGHNKSIHSLPLFLGRPRRKNFPLPLLITISLKLDCRAWPSNSDDNRKEERRDATTTNSLLPSVMTKRERRVPYYLHAKNPFVAAFPFPPPKLERGNRMPPKV